MVMVTVTMIMGKMGTFSLEDIRCNFGEWTVIRNDKPKNSSNHMIVVAPMMRRNGVMRGRVLVEGSYRQLARNAGQVLELPDLQENPTDDDSQIGVNGDDGEVVLC